MATLNEALVEFILAAKGYLFMIAVGILFYYASRGYKNIMQVHKKEVHIHNTFRYENCVIRRRDDEESDMP